MAEYYWLTEGLDPTGGASPPSNSALLQMVHQAKPSPTTGWVVYADAAPDTVTYPDLVRALWAKTTAGVPTGYYYWWDGADWQPFTIEPGTLIGDSFADHSIDINKLELTGSSPNYVLAVTAAGDAIHWESITNLISDGSLTIAKIEPAAEGSGMVIVSTAGGAWTRVNFDARVAVSIEDSLIEGTHIADLLAGGLPTQVLSLVSTGDIMQWSYADTLLRDNSVATKKLILGIANAGKTPRVNATGTDFDYTTAAVGAMAVLKYGGPMGTSPQDIDTGAVRTVAFSEETDPSGIITLTANQWTFTTAGTYHIRAYVPVYPYGAGASSGCIILRDITGASELDTATVYCFSGNGWGSTAILETIIVVTDPATIYELSIDMTARTYLWHTNPGAGNLPNRNSHAENFQRLTITKLA